MRDAFSVRLGQRNMIKKGARLRHGLIGVVRREHHPVHATQFQKEIQEGRVKTLSESLIAFCDTKGQYGLIDEFFPHSGPPLVIGRP